MSRVGILTFLHNDNYGSALQAYALQRVIRELGHECEHLDYEPDRNEKMRNLLRSGNSPKLILEGLRKRSVEAGQEGARAKSAPFPLSMHGGCAEPQMQERGGTAEASAEDMTRWSAGATRSGIRCG